MYLSWLLKQKKTCNHHDLGSTWTLTPPFARRNWAQGKRLKQTVFDSMVILPSINRRRRLPCSGLSPAW